MLIYLLIGINVLVSLIGSSRISSGAGYSMFVFSPSEVSSGSYPRKDGVILTCSEE
jgi:hypothetical protein